jgi:hypothetical protein
MWSFTDPFWEAVFKWATIAAAGFGGIGIVAAFVSAWVGYQITDATQKEADRQITAARTEIAKANENAAKANERAAEAQLALEKFKAPRWITDDQQAKFVARLEQFQNVSVDVWLLHAPSQDAAPFAARLVSVLTAAQWNARGVFNLMGGPTAAGVFILTRANPSLNDQAAAMALLNELHSAEIAAVIETGVTVTDNPVAVLGAFVGPDRSSPPSDLWLVVGSKP